MTRSRSGRTSLKTRSVVASACAPTLLMGADARPLGEPRSSEHPPGRVKQRESDPQAVLER
jgi:hypothetical protein